ncbi:hypothetical protein [Jatrophihabitans endophyticus]|uniref:hypothetical protein n=1 Tax=Jatrophihabitans endophyticus TaxID=1206085 RepID=UPI000932C998|nr:hypothetical protein [Jatrophihabitans endophyticus]
MRRTDADSNRRQVLVTVTEHGHQLTGSFAGPLVVEGQQLRGRLTRRELRSLRDLLTRITGPTDRHREDVVSRPAVADRS